MADKAKKGNDQQVVPVRASTNMFPGFEREFERFFGNRWPRLFDWGDTVNLPSVQAPKVDVVDREGEVCVRAELPGFNKKDIEVSVGDSSVTIKASSESESSTEEGGEYVRREISRGFVSRTVALPAEVDSENATAKMTDGVLEIVVPKVAKARRQKIEIAG